jgi:hypothetical protein
VHGDLVSEIQLHNCQGQHWFRNAGSDGESCILDLFLGYYLRDIQHLSLSNYEEKMIAPLKVEAIFISTLEVLALPRS